MNTMEAITDVRAAAHRIAQLSGALYEAFEAGDDVGMLSACDGIRNAMQVISASVVSIEDDCAFRERDTIPAPEEEE